MEKNTYSRFENPSKKRKIQEKEDDLEENLQRKSNPTKLESAAATFYVELHLDKPLPFEWQQCLDLQSGQIYFYNTRTKSTTRKDDPRHGPEPLIPTPMSLELELNLPHQSLPNNASDEQKIHKSVGPTNNSGNVTCGSGSPSQSVSSTTFDKGHHEMVAAACKRCHMLVMLCKASPTCPNCKFMHPADQIGTSDLVKTRLSLLC